MAYPIHAKLDRALVEHFKKSGVLAPLIIEELNSVTETTGWFVQAWVCRIGALDMFHFETRQKTEHGTPEDVLLTLWGGTGQKGQAMSDRFLLTLLASGAVRQLAALNFCRVFLSPLSAQEIFDALKRIPWVAVSECKPESAFEATYPTGAVWESKTTLTAMTGPVLMAETKTNRAFLALIYNHSISKARVFQRELLVHKLAKELCATDFAVTS